MPSPVFSPLTPPSPVSHELRAEDLVTTLQRETMRALGFELIAETPTTRHVTWAGHGIALQLDPAHALLPEQAAARIVQAALSQGKHETQNLMRKALALPAIGQ